MRFTIERLRTLVLAAGILLVAALGVFLAIGRIRSHFNARELPKRLGVNIQQEANGVTYSHALGAHAQFKIRASRYEQLRNGQILLYNVVIELYGQDGSRLDRIEGNEFTYDQKSGTAMAAGPVEITLSQPMIAPAIAPNATPNRAVVGNVTKPLASAAEAAASGEIKVETSGLTSNWNTGVTTTDQRVDFTLKQGAGSSMGASYDSQHGILVLDRDVELTTHRAGDTVHIGAQHAEFTRDELICRLRQATAEYRGGQAAAAQAEVLFRDDGSAIRLDAKDGFSLATSTGGHLAAPTGSMGFDEHNLPRHGHLEGGVRMDSISSEREVHGTSSAADLEFTAQGELRHAHLERDVNFTSQLAADSAASAKSGVTPAVRTRRTWRSPVAEVDFRPAGKSQVEPAGIHGSGGVVLTSQTQRGNSAPLASRVAADELNGVFGPGSALTTITGTGHASIAETTATGAKQTANGDWFEAHFEPGSGPGLGSPSGSAEQIQSAVLDGHVTLVQVPAVRPGVNPQAPMRATAGKATYESAGEWLHLTESPRVADGAMQLAADKIDISQQSGDAFADGSVKATWLDENKPAQAHDAAGQQSLSLGGEGPAHVVAQEAHVKRATDEAVFKGHARLWQEANSIAAPVIIVNRQKKTLAANSADPSQPVRVVLLSSERPESTLSPSKIAKSSTPSVIRVRGGELLYSDAARKAFMTGGSLGPVEAETATATSISNQVELYLLPSGAHAASGQGQVDRMIASGHVMLTSEGRRGTGEQLTYTGNTGEYVLTGTPSAPPRFIDPERGIVTGAALIFHSRDDSVSIEGGGHETRTETTVHQTRGKGEPQK